MPRRFPFGVAALAVLAILLAGQVLAATTAAIVMDARNGAVIYAQNADQRLAPASLTKMMTIYMAFEAIERGRLSLDRSVTISRHAAAQPSSKMGLKPGQKVTVRDLIRAAAIKSANDAAVALAEAVGGSEREFARMMTAKAAALGMRNSQFRNASGLPASGHFSSARDMAILARRLQFDFPAYYGVFGRREAEAVGRTIHNTNRLLSSYDGADGLKTGYTREAGYCLAASAERGGKRIIAVLLGGRSSKARNQRVAELLDLGFGKAPTLVAEVRPQATREPGVTVSQPPRRRGTPPPTLIAEAVEAVEAAVIAPAAAAEMPAPVADPPPAPGPLPAAALAAVTAPLQSIRPAARPARRPAARPPEAVWAVQLGAYKDRSFALKTLRQAVSLGVPALKGAKQAVTQTTVNGVRLYQARLLGLTQSRAEKACEGLRRLDAPCRLQQLGR